MLTIKVNGREEKLSIGCRTFVCLDVLLKILESDARNVSLNGETFSSNEFGSITIKGGDSLLLDCK